MATGPARVRSPAPRPVPDPLAPYLPTRVSLATQIALRVDEARDRFGPDTRVQIEGGAFVVVDAERAPFFEQYASVVRRTVDTMAAGPFPDPLEEPVTVFVFRTPKAYVAFSRLRYAFDPGDDWAFYRRSRREIVADGTKGIGTLVHELIHPMIQRSWEDAPAWINEGVASVFEAPVWSPDGKTMHGVRNWRYDGLVAAMSSPERGGQTRLDALFGMPDREFLDVDEKDAEVRRDVQLWHYGIARYVCQWLDRMGPGLLWPFFAAYRDGYAEDPTGKAAFIRTVGIAPADADAAWRAYVRSGAGAVAPSIPAGIPAHPR